jgi:CBS domain-containing protein
MAAATTLKERSIGALPVLDDSHNLIGMLSERDFVRALVERGGGLSKLRVSDAMSRNVVVCAPGNTVADAAALMRKYRIRHLPVVDEDLLVGILSVRDVLQLVEPAGNDPIMVRRLMRSEGV